MGIGFSDSFDLRFGGEGVFDENHLVEFFGRCLVQCEKTKDVSFDQSDLAGLRNGDGRTVRRFETHFRPLLRLKLWGRSYGRPEEEERLIDEVMAAVMDGIRREELREAHYLPRYVCSVCTRLMKEKPHSDSGSRDRRMQRRMVREQVLAF